MDILCIRINFVNQAIEILIHEYLIFVYRALWLTKNFHFHDFTDFHNSLIKLIHMIIPIL